MTYRAIRHDTGQETVPLLLVRNGVLTPRQCDHEFKGLTGDCPTCKLQVESADMGDGSTYAAAMAKLRDRGVSVSYKRFGYGSGGGVEPWRVCYFGHPPGYWEGVPFRDCQNQDTDSHRINLEVIRRYYERDFKPDDGYVIKVEPRLRRPGDPPRPYSPDLAIYGPKRERLVAVEYQRSYEAYEKFLERDMMRRSAPESWAAVDWWLDDTQQDPDHPRPTVYERSQMHRTYLSSIPVRHVRCFVDPETLKLQAEYGKCGQIPPERRKRVERHIEKADLKECSTARIVLQVEGQPEWQRVKEYKEPLRPKRGSELTFREDLAYSLERERRIAEAVINQQRRLEEQDRRHRQYEHEQKMQLVERIQAIAAESGNTYIEASADLSWDELTKMLALAKDVATCELERKQRESRGEKATQKWNAAQTEITEKQRQAMEAELHWHPVEMQPAVRGQQMLKTALRQGDRLRRSRWDQEEVYRGRTGSGYSTNRQTYMSLDGWQVWRQWRTGEQDAAHQPTP